MIPEQQLIDTTIIEEIASLTYKFDLDQNKIVGLTDDKEAINQAIMKILYTERYETPIYSGQYGVELQRLIGKNYDFIAADLERTITEALLADERILGVRNFTIKQLSGDSLEAGFTVLTIAGDTTVNTEVLIA